ncbi:Protein FAM83H [Liparis tanakae]|uniref:Protein FAM83H n=1 Tax=Liparis tanakae TaxID=230148 RepID=A0A4Z2H6R2_9TELE|nr:Protein FAM83H [Liparis tanakae]
MAHRSQSSSVGDNPLDPNYLAPHYREEYRLAIDALIESDKQGYFEFLQNAEVFSFLSQGEIEFIKSTIQMPNQSSDDPELICHEGGQPADGSSDTYWPMQSDLDAPGLDMGWPVPQPGFMGPTEVTTLVNPSDPDMPSIKEQARRLIKNARQVIAVVMDTFTDVDIFSDLLDAAARHIAVYILLDEQEAHNFVSMVENCKVNLDMHPMVRVRTVAGVTYYSRTGTSFKGQVKDRFLLADCKAVLSGNYSFTWSFEKIHRCIAHLFLGELVATFDEEFRILFAQSEPLVIDPSRASLSLSESSSTSSYLGNQFSLKRTQSLRNPICFRRQPEVSPAFPYGDSDRNLALPFRRNDPFRQTVEPVVPILIGKYSQQQFRPQQSYLDQGRSIVSRQMDLNSSGGKRHSYAEGTHENYSSSRQYMKNRVMNNLDETDVQREMTQSSYNLNEVSESSHGHYDRLRGRPSQLSFDQQSDSSYRSDPEPPPGKFTRTYFSTEDLRGPQAPPLAGRYGGDFTNKRPTIGQPYACQTSPTQLHPPEKKQNKHTNKPSDQEPEEEEGAREGMRSWRIQSYLSTYDESGEEGLAQPLGPDAFEDLPSSQQPSATEQSAARFGTKEPPNVPPKPRPDIARPRYGKPILNEGNSKDSDPTTTAKDPLPVSDVKSFALEQKAREAEKERERTSRLRSSLIFSSSKGEMHSGSLGLKPSTDQDEELDTVRTSSIVAQILEKRRSLSHVNMNDPAKRLQYFKDLAAKRNGSTMVTESSIKAPEPAEIKPDRFDNHPQSSTITPKIPSVSVSSAEEPKKTDISSKLAEFTRRSSFSSSKPPVNFSKPSLRHVEPSPPRKEESTSESQIKDIFKSLKPLASPKIFRRDPLKLKGLNPRRVSSGEDSLTTDATDAEKSEHKKSRSYSSSTLTRGESRDGLHKGLGSTTSINTLGESRGEGKTLDFLKKQTQRLKGFLGPKDKDKKSSGDDRGMSTVREFTEDSSRKHSFSFRDKGSTTPDQATAYQKTSTSPSGPSRYQNPGGSALYSSNLRDDTKVILEQISANSQKNRLEREETGGDRDGGALERQNSIKKSRFLHPQTYVQEREGLLKRIESLRKEKKVYSRFEV